MNEKTKQKNRGKNGALIPLSERSPEDLKRIQQMGVEAARKKAALKKSRREWAELIGSLPIRVVKPDGTDLEGADLDGAVVMQLYRDALAGQTKAARLILELRGDLEQNINLRTPSPIMVASKEEAELTERAIAERIRRNGREDA